MEPLDWQRLERNLSCFFEYGVKMVFIFIFTELSQTGSCLLQERVLGDFSPWLYLQFALGARPGHVEVFQHVEGGRGETGMTPAPSHVLPETSHIPLKREGGSFSSIPCNLPPTKICQGIKSHYSVSFRGCGKGPFLFPRQKRAIDPRFSLREEEKA